MVLEDNIKDEHLIFLGIYKKHKVLLTINMVSTNIVLLQIIYFVGEMSIVFPINS